jgi:transcription elongation GreA/GreB family factor
MQNSYNTMEAGATPATELHETISVRLQHVTSELREIHELLTSSETADPRILTDFRDALNRVRNTAWAVEQFANSKVSETDPKAVLSVLAGERVRVTFQLCRLVESDLANADIKFQIGQLMQLREAIQELEHKLATAVSG